MRFDYRNNEVHLKRVGPTVETGAYLSARPHPPGKLDEYTREVAGEGE